MDLQSKGIIRQDLMSRHRLDSIACLIEQLFSNLPEEFNCIIDLSKRIKRQIKVLDPFMEENTLAVCSKCKECCCINRYSYYNCDDLIYIMALDLRPKKLQSGDDSGPCNFLSSKGCRLERFVRPSGCNWYFCDSLHKHISEAPETEYADFSDSMEVLFNLWLEMISEFRTRFKELSGCDLDAFDMASNSPLKASSNSVESWHL